MRNVLRLLALLVVAGSLGAQQAPTATVTGVVFDSLRHAPFPLADVQLVRRDDDGAPGERAFFVTADSAGRYRFDNVAHGAYVAGFFHPRLDSLGLQPALRAVELKAGDAFRLDLGLPSARTVLKALCPAASVSDTTALVSGFVRDATTLAPVPNATVRIGWSQLVLDRGLRFDTTRVEVQANGAGWFAACGAPAGTTLMLRAAEGGDTSGTVHLSAAGLDLTHRDLFVGRSHAVARLQGTVRTIGGQPVPNARIRFADVADSAVTSDAGTYTVANLPAGSRTIDVRAVGFLPYTAPVDLVATSDGTRLDVTLTSLRAYLDTVKITRQRLYSTDRNGFESRRRSSGTGRFMDREQIDRRNAIYTTDLFRQIPGVYVMPTRFGDDVFMRANGMSGGYCRPQIYLDGMQLGFGGDTPGGSDLDIVQPTELDGIEVYTAAFAPPQYSHGMSGCGSILLWTHPPDPRPPREPKTRKTKNPRQS